MARPPKERMVEKLPPMSHYKPAGTPLCGLEEVVLTVDEMEAIRLIDIEQLDQAEAAKHMEVSTPTINRMANMAHQKIASALWQGCALRIEGGNFRLAHKGRNGLRHFICQTCNHRWTLPHGTGQRGHDLSCPACETATVSRDDDDNGKT